VSSTNTTEPPDPRNKPLVTNCRGFWIGTRILAAYGGVFVAGSLAWGMVADGYRPDRFDVIGALICLAGVA
jgi:drug/metabolite transporter superfamily protein YnfA